MSGRSYQLEPRDESGVFLGLGAVECALVGAGFVATIALRLAGVATVAAAGPLLMMGGLAKLQVGGRRLHQWIPLLAGWVAAAGSSRRTWRAPLPLFPASPGGAGSLPPALTGIDVVEQSFGGGQVGVIRDKRAATLTVVLAARPAGDFACADPGTQDALVDGWGSALATFAAADSPVVQVGWSHQGTATGLDEHRSWLNAQTDASPMPEYEDLVDEVAAMATRHETVVWLTVSGRRATGKGKLIDRAVSSLPGAVETFQNGLAHAGLAVGNPLSVQEVWRHLRRRADPHNADSTGSSLAARMGLAGQPGGQPLAIDTTWSDIHIDGTWHRVYWVDTWPRRPVPADWLTGFLLEDDVTMSVLHRPIDPARSLRRVDSQLVKLSAHRARKEEKGRRITEVDERTEQATHDLESDLASGHGEMLYLGLVCVSASSSDELKDRCHTVEQAARAAQLGLRVLHGRQDAAWAASLPLGLTTPGALEVAGL